MRLPLHRTNDMRLLQAIAACCYPQMPMRGGLSPQSCASSSKRSSTGYCANAASPPRLRRHTATAGAAGSGPSDNGGGASNSGGSSNARGDKDQGNDRSPGGSQGSGVPEPDTAGSPLASPTPAMQPSASGGIARKAPLPQTLQITDNWLTERWQGLLMVLRSPSASQVVLRLLRQARVRRKEAALRNRNAFWCATTAQYVNIDCCIPQLCATAAAPGARAPEGGGAS
jgi:hypothetical protein